ncbi:MAG: Serine/threonine-protein kinase PknA [Verrucomicrobiota bacterium]|jgi:serine/threonine protein kinase
MPQTTTSPSNWNAVTDSLFPWEDDALRFIRDQFPTGNEFHAWSNFEFIASDGSINEVDLLVASPWGIFLVEIKSRPGRITGDQSFWTWTTPEGRRHTVDNPLILANRKSKRLKNALASQPSLKKVAPPFIQPIIFCSAQNLEIRLTDDAMNLVALRDDPTRHKRGIRSALFRRECQGLQPATERLIDAPTLKAFAQGMAQAGLRRKKRRVSDFELDQLRYENPAGLFQDWLAHHSTETTTRRLIRIYLRDSRKQDAERRAISEMALREYRTLERLNHTNILKALNPAECEYGPAIIFGFDPSAQRLDHFLADNANSLDVTKRFELLRQIADAIRYAHDKKVLHRSLSPHSIFVIRDRDGHPRIQIYNWQTATKLPEGNFSGLTNLTLTQHGTEMVEDPTRAYLAPESFASDEEPTAGVDVFSLGALAFLIFGQKPPATDAADLLQKLRESPTRSLDLRQIADGVPDSIADLVRFSARTSPAERCTVEDFVEHLDLILEELTRPANEVADPRNADKGDILSNGYVVERQLGRGATSIALLVNKGNERHVLKVARDPGFNQRLRDEFELLKKLNYPNIVIAHDCFEFLNIFAFTVQLAGERTLARSLKEDGTPGLELLQRFGEELIQTVQYLDSEGLHHRDIKPENIGISEGPGKTRKRLRLFDFSLAMVPPSEIRVGTLEYLDPFLEQRKARRYDLSAELYAVAVTLHEMATGARPSWTSGHPLASQNEEITIRSELFEPDLREKCTAFFKRALRRDYRQRFDNAGEMLRAWTSLFETVHLPSVHPENTGDKTGTYISSEALLETATPQTQLTFLGLSTRLMNFLERQGIATVTDILQFRFSRFEKFVGFGRTSQRELLTILGRLRQKFPNIEAATAQPAPTITEAANNYPPLSDTLEAAAHDALFVKKGSADTEREVLHPFLGATASTPEDSLQWPGQTDLAARVQASRQRIGQLVTAARARWAKSPALLTLRHTITEILHLRGGVMAHRELVAHVVASRPSSTQEPERTRLAAAAVRAALEGEGTTDTPRFSEYRSGDKIFIALHPSFKTYATQLGKIADRLTQEQSLPAPSRVTEELRTVYFPRELPDIQPPNEARLRQLAVVASTRADLSSRGEIYPVGLDATRALHLSRNALCGEELPPDEITRRLKARFPKCADLPPRPELDNLLAAVGLDWIPTAAGGVGAYRTKQSETSLPTYSLGSRLTTRTSSRAPIPTDPDILEAAQIEERLTLSRRDGGYLVLTVSPSYLDRARTELEARFDIDTSDLDTLFLDALRSEANRLKANWDVVLAADASEPGSLAWSRLQQLVDRALPPIETALRSAAKTQLVLNPGLLARYGRMGLIHTLVADIGRQGGPRGLWILAPEDGQNPLPTIAGQPIPIINAAHHTRLTEHWLRNTHRAAHA